MPSSIIIGQGGGSGGGSGSNASVGLTGATAPTSATEIGIIVAGNLEGVSSANPLPISGTITASNPSVGSTGATAPTSATLIGVINSGGNLEGASATNPVRIDPTGTTVQPVSIGSPLGSQISADSVSVVVASDQATLATNISARQYNLETNALLSSNAVYIGAWHDTLTTGPVVFCSSYASIGASATSGFTIQQTDDQSLASFVTVRGVGQGITTAAGTPVQISAYITQRYWRVKYTNGATAQTGVFEIYTNTQFGNTPVVYGTYATNTGDTGGSSPSAGGLIGVAIGNGGNSGDSTVMNSINSAGSVGNGNTGGLLVGNTCFNSGVPGNGSTFLVREPAKFASVTATSSGSTQVIAGVASQKWRLLKFKIMVTSDCNFSSAGYLTIQLEDNTTAIGATQYVVWLPVTAPATPGQMGYDSGWIDFGHIGYVSTAFNVALNVNLSAAVTAATNGGVIVQVAYNQGTTV